MALTHRSFLSSLSAAAVILSGIVAGLLCLLPRSGALPHSQAAAAGPGKSFIDVTEAMGLKGMSGGEAAWGDFNNDGWVDLCVGGQVWRNDKGKRFVKVADLPGPAIWGDYDNDGYLDLFCFQTGRLFRNVKGEKFEEVKILSKLPTKVCLGATWGDFNNDGFLDLYLGGYEIWPNEEFPDVILMNSKGKQFVESWRQTKIYRARGVTAADFDEDGHLDVFVSNYRLQQNLLWKNVGQSQGRKLTTAAGFYTAGALKNALTPYALAIRSAQLSKLGEEPRFTEVALAYGAGGNESLKGQGRHGQGWFGHTIGSAWGDLDNDGHLDLFVGNFSHPPAFQDRSQFLRNKGPKGKFHFEDMTKVAKLRWQESYASPALGDYDNDGLLDLYFTTVYPGDKSVLYRNLGKWKFEEIKDGAGLSLPQTYQAAWADFDNDGQLDLVTGGRLFRNPGSKNHWLKVRLEGSGKVNRAAIGAQVRLRLGDQTLTRQVEGATGQGNQNDLTLHFGLGAHKKPVRLEIRWPDGFRQELETPVDRTIAVKRGARSEPARETGEAIEVKPGQAQLFLDDQVIAKREGLHRTMHQPTKRGAVIRSPQPGKTLQTRSAPAWDSDKRLWSLWVLGIDDTFWQSKDGLHSAPARPNIPTDLAVRDPADPAPARRFKAALVNEGFAVSPDGVTWTKLGTPKVPSSDEANLSYDPHEGTFIHSIKRGGKYGRSVAIATSRDFTSWTDLGVVFQADELDQKLGVATIKARLADASLQQPFHVDPRAFNVDVYNMGVFHYEGLYIGLPAMYHATGPVPNYPNTDGFHVVQLAMSRDLKQWHRLGERRPFIGPSRLDSGAYDLTQILPPSAPVVRGDELWFYYTGLKYRATFSYVGKYPNGRSVSKPNLSRDSGAVCLAVLRRDGFVSLGAGDKAGTLVTRPFQLEGNKLLVNVDAGGGDVTVEVLDEAGRPLAGYSGKEAASAPRIDQVRWQPRWKEHADLSGLKDKRVRLKFTLRNAKLYSFRVGEAK